MSLVIEWNNLCQEVVAKNAHAITKRQVMAISIRSPNDSLNTLFIKAETHSRLVSIRWRNSTAKKQTSIQSGLVLFGVDSRSSKSLNLFVYLNYFFGTSTRKSSQSSGKLSSFFLLALAQLLNEVGSVHENQLNATSNWSREKFHFHLDEVWEKFTISCSEKYFLVPFLSQVVSLWVVCSCRL